MKKIYVLYSIFIENRIKSSEEIKCSEQKITNITALKRATHTGMRMHAFINPQRGKIIFEYAFDYKINFYDQALKFSRDISETLK